MFNFVVIYYVIFVLSVFIVSGQISDKRLCANQACTVPISRARTLMRYGSPHSRILSFAPNEDVTVFSKSAGSKADLWGVEIKGKRGYIPKTHVREYKIFTTAVTYLVDTEENNKTASPQVPSTKEEVKEKPVPDPVQKPYEVVDGTTIYLNPEDAVKPTESPSPGSHNPNQQQTRPLTDAEQKIEPKGLEKGLPFASNFKEKAEGPIESASQPEKDTEEKIVAPQVSNEPKPEESLVDNVVSSLKNWINEESESELAADEEEEEEDDNEEEDEEAEVEDDNEDSEEEEEDHAHIQEVNQATQINENVIKEEPEKVDIIKPEEAKPLEDDNLPVDNLLKNQEDLQINKVVAETENLAASSEKQSIDQNSNPLNENLKQEDVKIVAASDNSQVNTNNLPELLNVSNEVNPTENPINNVPIDILMQEAGIHAHYTTEEPNYEIPPPIEEVTPNPADITPPQPVFQEAPKVEDIPEAVPKVEAAKEENPHVIADQAKLNNNVESSEDNLNPKDSEFGKEENAVQQEFEFHEEPEHIENVTEETQEQPKEELEEPKEVFEQQQKEEVAEIIEGNTGHTETQENKQQLEENLDELGKQETEPIIENVEEDVKQTEENIGTETAPVLEEIPEQEQEEASLPQEEIVTEALQDSPGLFSGI